MQVFLTENGKYFGVLHESCFYNSIKIIVYNVLLGQQIFYIKYTIDSHSYGGGDIDFAVAEDGMRLVYTVKSSVYSCLIEDQNRSINLSSLEEKEKILSYQLPNSCDTNGFFLSQCGRYVIFCGNRDLAIGDLQVKKGIFLPGVRCPKKIRSVRVNQQGNRLFMTDKER